ncbi:hypothetical protein GCM10010174_47360 [Kutzneria viridogrisea]|nr:hypothetical protein [Kutzneria viridogrisea]
MTGFTMSAHAAPADQADQHCAGIVSKQLDEHGASKKLAEACSPVSIEDALAKAKASLPTTRSVQGLTLLANEYKDANYLGDVIYTWYGDGGPCDSQGYHLVNTWSVEHNVSSVTGYNSCNGLVVNDEDSVVGTFDLPCNYLGHWNDNAVAMRVYRK